MEKTDKQKPEYYYHCMQWHYFLDKELIIMPMQADHIERVRQWRNAQMDDLRQNHVITKSEQLEYYHKHIWPDIKNKYPKNILLSILLNEVLIGYGGLVHIAWEHQRAEVSFLLDPKYVCDIKRYTNIFSRYLKMIKKLAFKDLGLERLYGETYATRNTQIAILEAAGFVREGILKKHVVINGERVDAIIHGCLTTERY